jgi:hypothetical protein
MHRGHGCPSANAAELAAFGLVLGAVTQSGERPRGWQW